MTVTPSSLNQTPVSRTSSSLQYSSGTGQQDLKQAMKEELIDRLYRSDKLFEKIFNTSLPQDLSKVTEDCIQKFKKVRLPTSGDETVYYDSFVKRLNIIKESLERRKLMEGSIFKDVLFEKYTKTMKEGTAKDAPLRPDILARVPPMNADEMASWKDVELCAEVKGQYADMIAQGATYARSIFDAQRTRYFVLVIFYEQTTATVSFGLFTPAWLCLSTKIDIRTSDGQTRFIREMAQIWTCKYRWSAGFDMTCNNTQCYVGEEGTFYLNDIFHRISVVGRQTRVDIISAAKPQKDDSKGTNIVYGLNEYTPPKGRTSPGSQTQSSELRRSARLAAKKAIGQASASPSAPSTVSQNRASPCSLTVFLSQPRYNKLIMKDSWPILSRELQEEQVFRDVRSKFGVPVILRSFAVTIQRDDASAVKSDTAWFFPADAQRIKLWRLNAKKTMDASRSSSQQIADENEEPEHRVHVRLLIQTEGEPLHQAESPKRLLQAVLHAMIGYWVIFDKGWLHRDVSSGNVLLMRKPDKRDKIQGFDNILTEDILEKYFDKCTGFITDGDLAVRWNEKDRDIAKKRSGTPPFMSRRIINAIRTNIEFSHSAIDDLESFVWVVFWAVLSTMETHKVTFSPIENDYWACLQSRDLAELDRRARFVATLGIQSDALEDQKTLQLVSGKTPSPTFAPFVGLLQEWLILSETLERLRLDRMPDNYRQFLKKPLDQYLEIGIKYLQEMPDSWPAENLAEETLLSN